MKQFIYIFIFSNLCYSFEIANFSKERIDFMRDYSNAPNDENHFSTDNNKLISMGLSFFIPGSGQLLEGKWKRGVAYLGVEFLLWNYKMNYDDKGDYYVNLYKEFADENWSFENWINHYYSFIDENDPVHNTMINNQNCNYDLIYQESNGYEGYCAPWYSAHYIEYNNEQDGALSTTKDSSTLHQLFSSQCEEGADYFMNGCTISSSNNYFDNMEITRDHHFYEGIGKYNLFFSGWKDVDSCDDPIDHNGNLVCRWSENKNGYDVALSAYKNYYQENLRAKSNKKYDYAENALTLIFINHLVSMVDVFFFDVLPIYNTNNKKIEGLQLSLTW